MTISHTRSRTTRIAAIAATGIALVLALAGCVKVDAEVGVNSDATATGTFSLALQKQAASMLGMSDLDAFTAGMSDDELSGEGSDIFRSADCSPSESDTDFVYSCEFTNMAFTDSEGPWQIVKNGNDITFTMHGTGSSDDSSDQLLGDASLGTMTVDVTFPGAISEITGAEKTSDTSATVSGSLNDAFDVKIVSAAESSGSTKIAALLVVLLALLVFALIVVVIVVMILRRRKPAADSPPAYVVPPPAPGAAPGDGGAPTVAGTALAEAAMAETAVNEPVATQMPTEPPVVAAPPPPPAAPEPPPAPPASPEPPPAPEAREEPTPPA